MTHSEVRQMTLSQDRIFVQIASYRDRECQWTIKDLFQKAKNPDRIFVGVCWQFIPEEDDDCFLEETRPEQVRIEEFHANEAEGLGWARQKAQNLWAGEEYFLQIDSHMRFVEHWDEKMLAGLKLCEVPWPVLTVYPPSYTPPDDLEHSPTLRVQAPDIFNEQGILRFTANAIPSHARTNKPFSTACIAGGFIFGSSRIVEKIQPDPHIYFFGEEVSLAVRLWTHGFDLYSPNVTLLYHYYIRKDGSRHWNDEKAWHEKEQRSLRRLRQLMEPSNIDSFRGMEDLGPFGLGAERTLAEYEHFAGVNLSGKTIAQHARTFPFVLTDEVATSILQQPDLKLSDNAHLFIIEDQGIAYSEVSGDFALLNASATYVWCLFEEGATISELVAAIAELLQTSQSKAEKLVAGLLTHWQGMGLVVNPSDEETAPPLHADNRDLPSSASEYPPCPKSQDSVLSRRYKLLDTVFEIKFATHEHEQWIHPVLAHMGIEQGRPAHTITTAAFPDKHYLYVDGKPAERCDVIEELTPLAKFKVLNLATKNCEHMLNLHAGVVSDGKACLLLPAAAGSGKTSLTAALVHAGFNYFSDESALLEPETCSVRPVPLSFTVKTSGVDILKPMYPELSELPVHERGDGKSVRYVPPPSRSIHGDQKALTATHVIFPRYAADAKTALTPISKVDALGRLLQHSVALPERLSLDNAVSLIQWIKRLDCYDLPFSSVLEAVPLINRLIDTKAKQAAR